MQNLKTVSSHDVVCIALEVHLWSARIQLKAEDLQKYSSNLTNLPDTALASLGSVKLCDPEVIRKFERIKREANLLLERTGLPLFGVRAIPVQKFDEVRAKLEEFKEAFKIEALKLLNNYDKVIGDWRTKWEAANPGYGHLLDRIPKPEAVFGRLSFDYHAYRVEPPKGVQDDESGTEFTTKLTGLRGELYAEASREAFILLESTFDKSGSRRDYITPKTLGPFIRIANRFRDFEMLDPSAVAAAELIEATVSQAKAFAAADKNNRISDGPLMLVLSMANTFANPASAACIAEKSRNEGTQSAFEHLMAMDGVTATVQTTKSETQTSELSPDHMTSFESSLNAMKACATQSLIQGNSMPIFDELVAEREESTTAQTSQLIPPPVQQVGGVDLLFSL
ncbi:DUF3150 domain-containing protein (plasmid) [Comamonas aquatica]|nr:DUF3150 domain-containing protein [Comamonas aquatica]